MLSILSRRIRALCLLAAFISLAAPGWATDNTFPILQAASGQATVSADIDSLRKQALEDAEAGKTDAAIRDYQRVLEIQPDWKEGRWNLGMLQYSSDRFAEAEHTFQKVVQFAPNLGLAWGLRGLSEYGVKDYDDALEHLERAQALGIAEDEEIARVSTYHLGILRIRAGKFESASDLLLAAFGTGVVSPQAKIALGLAILRVPLLPEQLDPSREALVLAAGDAATAGADEAARLATLLQQNPSVPYLHYAYGVSLAKAGKEKEAADAMAAETTLSPDSPLPWIALGRLKLRQGLVNDVLKDAREATRHAPNDNDAHAFLVDALHAAGKSDQAAVEKQAAAMSVASYQPEKRIVLLYANPAAKAGSEAGPNAQQWTQALKEYTAGEYPAAITDLKASLAATPDNGTGWALLGLSEFELKDYDNALIHLDRGAKLGLSASSESLYLARYTYGVLLVRAGRFEQAAEILASASSATGPLAAKVECAFGLVMLRRAELPDAAPGVEASLVTAAGRIESLLQQSKYSEAFPQFEVLLKQYPATPFLHYAYGTALIALSQFDEAAAQMRAELAISPGSELPSLRLASIALRQHEAAAASRWAQRALRLAPHSVEAHYLLGRASLESGDVTAAVNELEIACKLSPASPEIHFNLAKAYARAKMNEKAQQERDIFSRLSAPEETHGSSQGPPKGPAAHDNVGDTANPPADSPAPPQP